MEKAILITNKIKLNKIDKYDRVYIGAEFCQNLLPSIKDIEKILKKISHQKISFITPIVNEEGLTKIDSILKYFSNRTNSLEVIINDFGVLNLVHNKYQTFKPVLGRIMSSQFITLNEKSMVKNIDGLKELSKKYGINRIEIDAKGKETTINISSLIRNFKVSIYYPFLLVSTTKRCIFPHLFSEPVQTFENFQCQKECLRVKQRTVMSYPMIRDKIYLHQNSHFIKKISIPKNMEKINIDRIVFDNIYGE